MAIHTEWLGKELALKVDALTPSESHALLHWLFGYMHDNEQLKEALTIAALEQKI